MASGKAGVEEKYALHASLLGNDQSTNEQKMTAFKFVRDLLTSSPYPPSFFDQKLIDVLIKIVYDQENLELRIEALSTLVNLLRVPNTGFCSSLTHAFVDKNGFALFENLIDTFQAGNDEKLANLAMLGVMRIYNGCTDYRDKSRDLNLLGRIANQMVSKVIQSISLTRSAVECISACLRTDGYSYCQADPGALTVLYHTSHLKAEPMLEFPGLLTTVLRLISTGTNHSVIRSAATILGYFIRSTMRQEDVERRERILLADGFMRALGRCLSEKSKPWISPGLILHDIQYGCDAHVDLLIEHPDSPIPQLVLFLQEEVHKGSSSHIAQNAWKLCAKIFRCFLAMPRPILLQNYLGCGVLRPFIIFACENRGQSWTTSLYNMDTVMTQILPPLLDLHPEYRAMAVEAGAREFVPVTIGRKRPAVEWTFEETE